MCSASGESSSMDSGQTYPGGAGRPDSESYLGMEGRYPVCMRVLAAQGDGVAAVSGRGVGWSSSESWKRFLPLLLLRKPGRAGGVFYPCEIREVSSFS